MTPTPESPSRTGSDGRALSAILAMSLGLQFVLELATLAGLLYWGIETGSGTASRVLLSVGAPTLAIIFWAVFGSPKAPRRAQRSRPVVELVFFGSAALAMWTAGKPAIAVAFAVMVACNISLLVVLGEEG